MLCGRVLLFTRLIRGGAILSSSIAFLSIALPNNVVLALRFSIDSRFYENTADINIRQAKCWVTVPATSISGVGLLHLGQFAARLASRKACGPSLSRNWLSVPLTLLAPLVSGRSARMKLTDKRADMAKRDMDREIQRALKERSR